MVRYGITFPFDDIPLGEQRSLIESLPDLGYTDLWSAESNGADGVHAARAGQRVGAAAPARYGDRAGLHAGSRDPGDERRDDGAAAPGRFVLGIGSSSNVIVEQWNCMDFDRRTSGCGTPSGSCAPRLSGAKVSEEYETFVVNGFRWASPPPEPPTDPRRGAAQGHAPAGRS